MVTSSAPHFLFFPFPGQGHINPMLRFASDLLHVAKDSHVTFINTQRSAAAMIMATEGQDNQDAASATVGRLHFVSIPDGLSDGPGLDMSFEAFANLLASLERQQAAVEQVVERSMASGRPISCLVADMFMPWMQGVADKFHIPRAVFWSCNATSLYLATLAKARRIYPQSPELERVKTKMHVDEGPLLSQYYGHDAPILKLLERMDEANHVLVNTCDDLEGPLLEDIANPKVTFVGPCVGPAKATNDSFAGQEEVKENLCSEQKQSDKGRECHQAKPECESFLKGSLLREDVECLRWLDKQERNSVLYISFGSVSHFSPSQVEEMALGIQRSKQPFIWVARLGRNSLSKEFYESTKDMGLVISWAPQLAVLQHPAVGAFFTHCGWNSILESMTHGVPMLCLPTFGDQFLNACLVEKHWQVGIVLKKRDDGVVDNKEVDRCIRAILVSKEGTQLQNHATCLKKAISQAIEDKQKASLDSSRMSWMK